MQDNKLHKVNNHNRCNNRDSNSSKVYKYRWVNKEYKFNKDNKGSKELKLNDLKMDINNKRKTQI